LYSRPPGGFFTSGKKANVARKGQRTNRGVRAFFRQAEADASPLYLSVVTVGELRRGVDLIRHRGDHP